MSLAAWYKLDYWTEDSSGYSRHASPPKRLNYKIYASTQTYHTANGAPTTTATMDAYFNETNVPLSSQGYFTNSRIAYGTTTGTATILDAKPSYFNVNDYFALELSGYLYAPEAGTYQFAIDSDDASDLFIDDVCILGWYGPHGNVSNWSHSASVTLTKGVHKIKARLVEINGGDCIAVGWKKPSDPSITHILMENMTTMDPPAAGKIDNAFVFGGTDNYIDTGIACNSVFADNQSFTISCWAKINSWPTAYSGIISCSSYYSEPNGGGFSLNITGGTGAIWTLIGDTTSSTETAYGEGWTLGVWTNLVMRFDGSSLSLWKDGVLVGSVARTTWKANINKILIGRSPQGGWDSVSFNGLIDDVRIYTHALSDKEVMELARAKILHYTFDDLQEPVTNLSVSQAKPFAVSGVSSVTSGTDATGPYFIKVDTVYGWAGVTMQRITVPAGSYVATSFEVMSDVAFAISWDANDYSDNYTGNDNTRELVLSSTSSYTTANTWQKVSLIKKIKADAVNPTTQDTFAPVDAAVLGHKIYYRNLQVELKDHVTPYVNGWRHGAIKDCSGYGYNSTLSEATTPTWVTTSKVGAGAYKFSGAQRVYINNLKISATQDISYCVWVKVDSAVTATMAFIAGQQNTTTYFGTSGDGNIQGIQDDSGILTAGHPLVAGQWTHLVYTFSYDGATTAYQNIYMNGVLVATRTDTAYADTYTSDFWLGYDDRFYRWFTGYLDDVRIYLTVLSEDAIKEMYQQRASLEYNGNLSTRGFIETAGQSPSLNENGVMTAASINEVGPTNNLVGWWKFNGNAKDISGYKSNGTVIEAIPSIDGYTFDGVNDYISCGTSTAFNVSQLTINVWVKPNAPTATSQYRAILSKQGATRDYNLYLYSSDGISWNYLHVSSAIFGGFLLAMPSLATDTFSMISVTIDLTGKHTYYLNGTSFTTGQGTAGTANNAYPVWIGRADNYFGGTLKDLRIYSRALTTDEIMILYQTTLGQNRMKFSEDKVIYVRGEFKEV